MTEQADNDLATVWQELGESLRGFFARRVPSADVDDLVQECFLRVSQGIDDLEDQEHLGAWVFRIARNLVTDHHRRGGASASAESGELTDSPDGDDDEADLDRLVAGWLVAMVEQLPENYANVVRDSELNGAKHREIAERTGLSVSGVKSRVQRGRELLREKLQACCEIEFDRRGRVRDYRERNPQRDDCEC